MPAFSPFRPSAQSLQRLSISVLLVATLLLVVSGPLWGSVRRGSSGRTLRDGCSLALLAQAEANAAAPGGQVLAQGRKMTVEDRVVLPGSCWDYANAVYERAGFKAKERRTIFRSKLKGPFASAAQMQAGDWLYFVNHPERNGVHSSIFVAWKNQAAMQAYVLSYPGEKRKETARYQVYDLRRVYQVTRPVG